MSEQRDREFEQWHARLERVRAEAKVLLAEDLDRKAEESERIVARALRQLQRGY